MHGNGKNNTNTIIMITANTATFTTIITINNDTTKMCFSYVIIMLNYYVSL